MVEEGETAEGPGEEDGDVWHAGAACCPEDARGAALCGRGVQRSRDEEDVGVSGGKHEGEVRDF